MSCAARLTLIVAWSVALCAGVGSAHAATYFVVPGAPVGGVGTSASAPTGDLCRAINLAKEGDQIWAAEGTLALSDTCVVGKRRLSLLGGYKDDFLARDAFAQPTRIVSSGKSVGLLRVSEGSDDLSVDGFVFDGGSTDAYTGDCPDCLGSVYDPARHLPLIAIAAGRVRLRSLIIVNAPGGGVDAKSGGSLAIDNVAVVNARPFAFRFAGACGYASPQCFDITLTQASVVWTWKESNREAAAGGSAIVLSSGASLRVERSVIAYSERVAIELDGTLPQHLVAAQLVVFDNRQGDIGQMQAGQLKAAPIAQAGVAQGLQGPVPGGRMERLALPWDSDYLARFLARASKPFYGVKLPWERAFMLSPAAEVGLKPAPGSRFSYGMAVQGGPLRATQAAPPPDDADDDDKKDQKGKKGQRKSRKLQKK